MEKIDEEFDNKDAQAASFTAFPVLGWPASSAYVLIWEIAWRQTLAQLTTTTVFKVSAADMPREWLN
jgi:hypothetical protein